MWLGEAAAAGTTKIRVKIAQAVSLAKLFDARDVDWALGHAAVHARFAEADLASILDHHATTTGVSPDFRGCLVVHALQIACCRRTKRVRQPRQDSIEQAPDNDGLRAGLVRAVGVDVAEELRARLAG